MKKGLTPRRRNQLPQRPDLYQEGPADEIDSSSESSDEADGSEASSAYEGLSSDEETEQEPGNQDNNEVHNGDDNDGAGGDDGQESDTGSASTAKASESSADPLARLLRNDPTLSRVEINIERLKDWSSTLPIEDVMMSVAKQSSLKTLHLDLEHVSVAKYSIIFECLKHTETVSELKITRARFNRETANLTGVVLARIKNILQKISFDKCTFSGSGLAVLFLSIQHLNSMTHFVLKETSLTGFASEIVSASLPLLTGLQSLRLDNTQIPLEGLRYLFDNMAQARSIVELDLSNNELDIQSITWLIKIFKDQTSAIETLILSGCDLDAACVELLCRGLLDNKKLLSLTLADNKFGDVGAKSLVNLLRENHHLQNLNVKGCQVGKTSRSRLHDGLRYNNSFLKTMFSTEMSLAILDSVSMLENLPGTFSGSFGV